MQPAESGQARIIILYFLNFFIQRYTIQTEGDKTITAWLNKVRARRDQITSSPLHLTRKSFLSSSPVAPVAEKGRHILRPTLCGVPPPWPHSSSSTPPCLSLFRQSFFKWSLVSLSPFNHLVSSQCRKTVVHTLSPEGTPRSVFHLSLPFQLPFCLSFFVVI